MHTYKTVKETNSTMSHLAALFISILLEAEDKRHRTTEPGGA